jgi:hypothetical protein
MFQLPIQFYIEERIDMTIRLGDVQKLNKANFAMKIAFSFTYNKKAHAEHTHLVIT